MIFIRKGRPNWARYVSVYLGSAVAVFFFTPQVSFANESSAQKITESSIELAKPTKAQSRWNFESMIQAHSVAGVGSPWLGMSVAYRVFEPVNFGFRGFLPSAHTVDEATYAIQSYLRIRMYHGANTDLVLEPEVSENFADLTPFLSYGLAIGVSTRILPGISLGVMGGVEVASVVIDSIGVEDESSLAVYPKIGLFANFNL